MWWLLGTGSVRSQRTRLCLLCAGLHHYATLKLPACFSFLCTLHLTSCWRQFRARLRTVGEGPLQLSPVHSEQGIVGECQVQPRPPRGQTGTSAEFHRSGKGWGSASSLNLHLRGRASTLHWRLPRPFPLHLRASSSQCTAVLSESRVPSRCNRRCDRTTREVFGFRSKHE